MRIDILTLFPEIYAGFLNTSIAKRAIEEEKIQVNIIDFRTYSDNKHKNVDDYAYGGGAGMVIAAQPIVSCLESIPNFKSAHKILTTPQGSKYNQEQAIRLAQQKHLIIICGHYEGIDARIEEYTDEEISIGDYILTGGELASLVIIDSVMRLLPGVLGNEDSLTSESFDESLLEYPQYTRPEEFNGLRVPEVLLSGNHEKIRQWRRFKALENTYKKRPDLLKKATLSKEDLLFLKVIKKGQDFIY